MTSAALVPAVLVPSVLVPSHGVGSRQDLPLPFAFLVVGAALALVISFVALGFLWRTPRLRDDDGRLLPQPVPRALDSSWLRGGAVVLALALTAWTLMALAFGADTANNPTPYVVFVWLWIGLAALSLLLGPVWSVLNPMRWLHLAVCRVARIDPDHPLVAYRLGYWPAAVGLLLFTWLELIAPNRTSRLVLGAAVAGFVLVSLIAALLFGRAWFSRGDPFEVLSRLFGSLSLVGRRPDGRWVLRTPLTGVDQIRSGPGLLAATAVLLGSTAYDGFSSEPRWFTFVQTSPVPVLTQTAGLLGFCGLVAGSLWAAAGLAARLGGVPGRGVATAFAPSLVPIAAGYVVAHYWSLAVYSGQVTLALLSDPLGTGANWLGTRGLTPSSALLAPTLVASVQAGAIVLGHLLGIVHAHERALTLFPRRSAIAGQVPMLLLMVGYTVGGLVLLFSS